MIITDEMALRQACYDAPDDDAPWLILEDFYRERGNKMADRVWALRETIKRARAEQLRFLPVALPIADFAPPEPRRWWWPF